MLNYTGHPLYDVGVATITAFAGKREPEELTEADLDEVANYLAELYLIPVFVSHLSITFTINSGFTSPSFSYYLCTLRTEYGQLCTNLVDR